MSAAVTGDVTLSDRLMVGMRLNRWREEAVLTLPSQFLRKASQRWASRPGLKSRVGSHWRRWECLGKSCPGIVMVSAEPQWLLFLVTFWEGMSHGNDSV